MDLNETDEEKKEIKRGYDEEKGFFIFTFGAIYWNTEVVKYPKLALIYFYYVYISLIISAASFVYSSFASIRNRDFESITDSVNFSVVAISILCVSTIGIFHQKSFDYFFREVGRGYFTYEGETNEQDKKKYYEERKRRLKTFLKPFAYLCLFVAVTTDIGQPLIHYLKNEKIDLDRYVGRYPPLGLYTPWNPHTKWGYAGFIVLNAVISSTIEQTLISMYFGFLTFISSVTMQYKILNHSVMEIEKRALKKYFYKHNFPITDDIYKDSKYHECIYDCLIENIKHHQAILRLKKALSPYLSWVFLIVLMNTSLLMAANGIIILEAEADLKVVKYVAMFCMDLAHAYFFCVFGEELISESEKLFEELYSSPWYKLNVKIRKTQLLFMTNATRPAEEKAVLFGIAANMETFNSMLSSAYTYINLVRSTK